MPPSSGILRVSQSKTANNIESKFLEAMLVLVVSFGMMAVFELTLMVTVPTTMLCPTVLLPWVDVALTSERIAG